MINIHDRILSCIRCMAFLQQQGIMHRDLAARNILIKNDNGKHSINASPFLNLCLHHIARRLGSIQKLSHLCGQRRNRVADSLVHMLFNPSWFSIDTLIYSSHLPKDYSLLLRCAPEVMEYHMTSTASDVWAFGVLYWEVIHISIIQSHKHTIDSLCLDFDVWKTTLWLVYIREESVWRRFGWRNLR